MICSAGQASLSLYAEAKLARNMTMAVNKQKVAKKRATVGKAPARGKKPSTGKKTAAVKSSPGPATGKTRAAGDKPATASTQHPPLIRVLLAEHRHIATVMQLSLIHISEPTRPY